MGDYPESRAEGCYSRVDITKPTLSLPAPCAPLAVNYTGDNLPAMLSWEAAVLATQYTVYVVTGDGRTQVCSTTELSCQLNNVQPGAIEVTASNAVGESVPTKDINGEMGKYETEGKDS